MIQKLRLALREQRERYGFTVVEMIIVIAVLGILAGIAVVSYASIDDRADDLRRKNDMLAVQARLEQYALRNSGLYPATTANTTANWRSIDVETDAMCFNGSQLQQWVPGFTDLPQSVPNVGSEAGVDGSAGCYLYASNGQEYVLSAWNMLSEPDTDPRFYRRLGFRTFQTATSTQFYTCNENVTGGQNGGYDAERDYYKHSLTISNITDCDETPPPGA